MRGIDVTIQSVFFCQSSLQASKSSFSATAIGGQFFFSFFPPVWTLLLCVCQEHTLWKLLGDCSDTCVNLHETQTPLNRNASRSWGRVRKGARGGVSVTVLKEQVIAMARGIRRDTEDDKEMFICVFVSSHIFTFILLHHTWAGVQCGISFRHLNYPKHSVWLSHQPLPSFAAVSLTEMESCPSRFYNRQPLPLTFLKGEAFGSEL